MDAISFGELTRVGVLSPLGVSTLPIAPEPTIDPGWSISRSESSMAISAPVRSTSTPRHFVTIQVTKICSGHFL